MEALEAVEEDMMKQREQFDKAKKGIFGRKSAGSNSFTKLNSTLKASRSIRSIKSNDEDAGSSAPKKRGLFACCGSSAKAKKAAPKSRLPGEATKGIEYAEAAPTVNRQSERLDWKARKDEKAKAGGKEKGKRMEADLLDRRPEMKRGDADDEDEDELRVRRGVRKEVQGWGSWLATPVRTLGTQVARVGGALAGGKEPEKVKSFKRNFTVRDLVERAEKQKEKREELGEGHEVFGVPIVRQGTARRAAVAVDLDDDKASEGGEALAAAAEKKKTAAGWGAWIAGIGGGGEEKAAEKERALKAAAALEDKEDLVFQRLEAEAEALEEELEFLEDVLMDLEILWDSYEFTLQAIHAFVSIRLGQIKGAFDHGAIQLLVNKIEMKHIVPMMMMVIEEDDVDVKNMAARDLVQEIRVIEQQIVKISEEIDLAHDELLEDLDDILQDNDGDMSEHGMLRRYDPYHWEEEEDGYLDGEDGYFDEYYLDDADELGEGAFVNQGDVDDFSEDGSFAEELDLEFQKERQRQAADGRKESKGGGALMKWFGK